MSQTLSIIFEAVEEKNKFPIFSTSMIPKEFMYRKVKKSEMKKISEAVDAIEYLVERDGLEILDTSSKTFIDKNILEQQIIYNRLQTDKKISENLREAILERLEDEEILSEGFIQKAKDIAGKTKETIKAGAEAVSNTANAASGAINNWMQVAVEEAKKVILTFAKAMGEFGVALVEFLKGFGDIDYKAVWVMIKDRNFVGLAKSAGLWLMKRITDGIVLYKQIFNTLDAGIFKYFSESKPVEALRDFLQKFLQDKIDKLTDPNIGNPEIKKIVDEKYNGDIKEALNDKQVLRLTLADSGILKTLAKYGFRTAIGTLMAYISWETWNEMVFKGDLIFDYNFSAAIEAIGGKFNVADHFLSSDGGFETLLWLIAGKLGMGSIASSDKKVNIKIAVVVTLIMLWIKKNPVTWKSIKDSAFAKKVVETYEESKKRISGGAEAILSKFQNIKTDLFVKMGFLKRGGPAV